MTLVTLTPTTALHKAFDYEASNAASAKSNPGDATTEFGTAEYTNVQVDDDALYAFATSTATTLLKYANTEQKFTFDLSTYNSGGNTITAITIKWSGKRTVAVNDDDIIVQSKMYIDSAGAWQTDVATIQSTDTAATMEWSKTWNSGFPLVSNILKFGLIYVVKKQVSGNENARIDTNYVAVVVTYSSGTAHTATITEIFGALDSKTRVKTLHRILTELFGALDAKTRVKSISRTFIEFLGGFDSRTRVKSIFRTITETFGASDTFSKLKTVITTILHGDAWGRRKRKPQTSNTVLALIRDWLEARRHGN